MIGLAKEGTLHARRQALGFVYDPELVKSLFEQVGEAVQRTGCRFVGSCVGGRGRC
jgi:ribosomal protein L17